MSDGDEKRNAPGMRQVCFELAMKGLKMTSDQWRSGDGYRRGQNGENRGFVGSQMNFGSSLLNDETV